MSDIKSLYKLWLKKTKDYPELYEELLSIENEDGEIADRFYRALEFGTAGLRGLLGAGTNRMNVFTVNQVTQGLSDFLNSRYESAEVAVAYDSRINSELFARETASVLAANGITAHIFPALVPTPMLSFAVRRLGCASGVVITASHNPSRYNGYKCYDPEGYQMTDEAAAETYGFIQKTDIFGDVKKIDFDEGLALGKIKYIPPELNEEFYQALLSAQINPGVSRDCGLKVIYTPLNGAGNIPVREVLGRIGLENVSVVPTQEMPDGNFPTCPYPNPEIRQAFEEALKLADVQGADLLLATDPDCDRVGIAVKSGDDYRLFSGNEMGALLSQYVLSCRSAQGTLPEKPVIVKTIVTTDLVTRIARDYSCEVVDLLTGFKYIGEHISLLAKEGREDSFILGMEESYGYLAGTHVRDKDAVVASMLICEMAAYYKKLGKSLVDVIDDIYDNYGFYLNTVLNFAFEGESGMIKMRSIMDKLRAAPPAKIAGLTVSAVSDYAKGETVNTATGSITAINLPESNVLAYKLPENCGVIVRPSGTEPKIKVYITARGKDKESAKELAKNIGDDMKKILGIED